jgi:O-antigen/teichoic acid export membrane protein
VVALLIWGGDAIGLVILDTIMNILVIAFNGYFALRKLKVIFKLHSFNPPLIKQIFSYSIWIFVFALVGQFQWKAGQIVLGALTNTTLVAIYAVGILLGTYYGAFSTAISGVFLPRATKMTVNQATSEELTEMMLRIGRISLLVLLLVLGGFFLYGQQFVSLWVGDTYKEAWLIALIIMIAYTTPLVQAFGNLILEAKSLFSFKAITYISCIGLGTLFGAFLVGYYGILGMIIGTTSGWMISLVIMNVYYHKVIRLNIPYFFKNLFSKTLPAFVLIIIIGYFIEKIPGIGWLNLGIKIAFFAITYTAIMYLIGMHQTEKKLIKNTILKFK